MTEPTKPYDTMPVHDEFVPEDLYTAFIERMPQCCVEVVLETGTGILLAKRTNPPRVWFWPGGRLYKGETLETAAERVAREELGLAVELHEQLGPYAHFWDAAATDDATSRHTINIVYHATPAADDFEITLDEQHSDYRFVTDLNPDFHEYVRLYLEDNDLL